MEEIAAKLREELLSQENQLQTLEKVLASADSDIGVAEILWCTDELVFVLLQNFIGSFYTLNTELFDANEVYKVKLCLDILTSIAQKVVIEELFLKLQLDYYIYPFLISSDDESLKMSALKLFSAFLKNGVHEGIRISELLPLLLKIIDSSNENCQVLALDTLDHILTGSGLDYAVQTLDRFRAMDVVLSTLVKKSVFSKNLTLLKRLLKIYTRLSERNNVRMKIKEKLPEGLESKEMLVLCEKDEELHDIWKKFIQIIN